MASSNESSNAQWEQTPRLRQIKLKLHKFREYVRIYLLSNIEVTRDNSVYISFKYKNIPPRPYMMHKVSASSLNLQVYDYFLKEPRPNTNLQWHSIDYTLPFAPDLNNFSDIDDDESDIDSAAEDIFGSGIYANNMMLPLKQKQMLNKTQNILNIKGITDKHVWFKFLFNCLHRESKGYSSEMAEFGAKTYNFNNKTYAKLIIADITDKQSKALAIESGKPSYIPIVHLFNHWLNDLQILSFNQVIVFVNDIITASNDIDELILDSHSISQIVGKTLSSIKKTWDMYADNEDMANAKDADLSSDIYPYEFRQRNKGKLQKNDQQISGLKKILFRKFLFLFVIASKIDYHRIKSNKKKKNEKYKRLFDCALLYWFVRSIYYYQRASIPYILALFRDECDIIALNILWEAIQINVKCCTDFETFLYLAPFINFFDAIDCFLRSSDQKRSIQSPEILKSNLRTQKTAKLVFKMIEIDLSLPVPSNRRFPVEGILLAKMSSRSQHQNQFINLLKVIQQTTTYWDDREKTQYLTSMFQRHHSTISRILDWNWLIHDNYYTFCQTNKVLHIGTATQEPNMVTKMQNLTTPQFNDAIFQQFLSKWYQTIFNQQITDALLHNTHIDGKIIRKFLRTKLRQSISTTTQSPTYRGVAAMSPKNAQQRFRIDSLNMNAEQVRLHSASIMTDSKNTNTFDWFSKQCLNETSDAIILMIENFVKQGKKELALDLLQHLLATDQKYSGDDPIFDQLAVLIANPHYYRLPLVFQALLGKILNYIHWFPPNELQEIPPSIAHGLFRPASPSANSYYTDLPPSTKPTAECKDNVLQLLDTDMDEIENGSPRLLQSTTSSFSDEKLEEEEQAIPPFIPPPPPPMGIHAYAPKVVSHGHGHNHGHGGRTAFDLMGGYNKREIPPPATYNSISQTRKIKPGSIMDKRKSREKKRSKLQQLFGTNDFPELPESSRNLMVGDREDLHLKELVMDNSDSKQHEMELHDESNENHTLYFNHHVLTFEEKKEIMSWLSLYCCVSRDIEMYSFWDVLLLNIVNLPQILDIDDYDTSLFSDASQILSPKRQNPMQFDDGDMEIEEDELKLTYNNETDLEPDKDESRIDLYLAYIMNEYDKINEEGTNIYKLNLLHNQITMIFEECSGIIVYGLRCNDVIRAYLLEKQSIQSKESKEKEIDKEDIAEVEKEKFIFLSETLKPWLSSIFCIFHDQLKSGHVLVKTLEFIGSNMDITKQLGLLLDFCGVSFADLDTDIEQRLKCLLNLQNEIKSIQYTDDLKQRIKQNIVQWHYLTLLQVDQLITTLLNDTKAPTDLNVSYRCGNYIQLDWKPPTGAQFEYVKYEISQQLAHKTHEEAELANQQSDGDHEGKEYLDPSTHLLGVFNVNKPPICITINLSNFVIIPTTHNDVSKPVVATNCLLRIRGITNKIRKEIKSAWSDSVNVAIFNTELIEKDMAKFIQTNDKNVDYFALHTMVDDGFNYEENEIKGMSAMIDNEVNALEVLIKNAQENLLTLQNDKINLEKKNKKLPVCKHKCNELFMKLNYIYTASVDELEDKIERWTVPDCLCWFDRVGLCRFSKYHSVLKDNLNMNHVKNFLKFTAKDLNKLGIDATNDGEKNNDCERILHYISKCRKKQKEKLQKRKQTQELERKKKLSQKIQIAPHAIRALSDPAKSDRLKFPKSPPRAQPKYYTNYRNNKNNMTAHPQPQQQQQHNNNMIQMGNVAEPRTNYHNPLSVHHPSQNRNNYNNNYNYNVNQARYNKPIKENQQRHPPPYVQERIRQFNDINFNYNNMHNVHNNNRAVKQRQLNNSNRYKMWHQQQAYQQQRQHNYANYTTYNNNNNYNNYNNNNNNLQIPADFICPISKKIMNEPVMEKWLKTNNTSPVFRKPLRHKMLMPYNELAGRINIWKQHCMK